MTAYVLERIDTPAELREASRLLHGSTLTAREREALVEAVRDYQDRRPYHRARTPTLGKLVAVGWFAQQLSKRCPP